MNGDRGGEKRLSTQLDVRMTTGRMWEEDYRGILMR